jgi:hypothetical protein
MRDRTRPKSKSPTLSDDNLIETAYELCVSNMVLCATLCILARIVARRFDGDHPNLLDDTEAELMQRLENIVIGNVPESALKMVPSTFSELARIFNRVRAERDGRARAEMRDDKYGTEISHDGPWIVADFKSTYDFLFKTRGRRLN